LRKEAIIVLILRQTAIGLVLALLVALPATAQDFQKGLAATKRGDYATALSEWRRLAEQGHARGQHNLSVMYGKGLGVTRDYAEALKWSRMAANQGLAQAQNNVGQIFRIGLGVQKDYAEALKWFRKAAEQGLAEAQINLGVMYAEGEGVPQDYVLAHMWFILSTANGSKKGRDNRDIIAKEMTPAQIAEARRLVRHWWARHKKK